MSKSPIVEEVLNYYKEDNILFCMPGHKKGTGFTRDSLGEELFSCFMQRDITEVEPLDNYHNPQGIIKEAEDLLTKFYGSYKSKFLVNGSTSGNLAMVFSAFKEKDKIIVERNCHRSVLNAIILRKLNPIYIENSFIESLGTPLSINEEDFFHVLNKHPDVKGIILTYPNYYGVCCDLEKIIKTCHERNMVVLVDGAHGAHFGVHEDIPKSAVKLGADVVVTSAHKTLPALTQGSYIHINNKSLEEMCSFYISAFTTTSPSYLIMCSLDYSRYYLETYGHEDYEATVRLCREYREKIIKVPRFDILGKKHILGKAYDIDETRYVITLDNGYSGHKFLEYLRKNKIQAEMSDDRSVVLLFSTFTKREELERLYQVILDCDVLELLEEDSIKHIIMPRGEQVISPYEAFELKGEYIYYKDCENKIALKAIVPYPPGVPLVAIGERITKDIIEIMENSLRNKQQILGVIDDKIYVSDSIGV